MLLDARLPHESCLASSRPSVTKTERNGKRRYSSEGGLGRVGSGRVGSGRVGSGRVGSGRVGSGRVGSGRVGYHL